MTKPKIVALWAEDLNGLIGFNNYLPWHNTLDLQNFKKATLNSYLIMGRATFDGMGGKSLPHRKTIVLTSDPKYITNDANTTIVYSVDEALDLIKTLNSNVFICGGKSIYKQFMPYVDTIIKTTIMDTYLGDTYIDPIDTSIWKESHSCKYTHRQETPIVVSTFIKK